MSQFCTQCGIKNDNGNFCIHCGAALENRNVGATDQSKENAQTDQHINSQYAQTIGLTESEIEEFRLFVGAKPTENKYYTEQYLQLKATHASISWNWAAFLFAIPWAFYRKMYLPAILMFAFVYILPEQLIYITSFLVMILCGMFGNHFYFKRVEKHLAVIKDKSDNEKETYRKDYGGVSILAATACYAGCILAFFLADTVLYTIIRTLQDL